MGAREPATVIKGCVSRGVLCASMSGKLGLDQHVRVQRVPRSR